MSLSLIVFALLTALVQSSAAGDLTIELKGSGPIQGEPALIVVRADSPLREGTASWLGQTVVLTPLDDGALAGFAAIDRNQQPGASALTAKVRFADGSEGTVTSTIVIQPKTFPSSNLSVDPRFTKLSKEDLAWIEDDNRAAARAYASTVSQRLWNLPFALPAEGPWSSGFGERRMFNGTEQSFHSGADIAVPTGTRVFASARGRVALVKNMFFGGNTVLVDHGYGVFTGYMHLSEFSVKEGDAVEAGQLLGISGATGRVTGPHLHWMLRINGIRVNARGLIGIK